MKRYLLLLVALACTGAVAQERTIWACQMVDGVIMDWEAGRWTATHLRQPPLLLTIDGANSSMKEGDRERSLQCSILDDFYVGSRTTCISSSAATYIVIDNLTGDMGRSFLSGAISPADSDGRKDSVTAQIYNCTKF